MRISFAFLMLYQTPLHTRYCHLSLSWICCAMHSPNFPFPQSAPNPSPVPPHASFSTSSASLRTTSTRSQLSTKSSLFTSASPLTSNLTNLFSEDVQTNVENISAEIKGDEERTEQRVGGRGAGGILCQKIILRDEFSYWKLLILTIKFVLMDEVIFNNSFQVQEKEKKKLIYT